MKRAWSDARKTTASAMSGDLAEAAERRLLDDGADRRLGAREQAELGHVDGELHAHRRRDQAGIDAVDADAEAELAGLERGDAGQPVDGRLRRGVAGDPGERDRRRDRRDVDDRAAVAGRAVGPHRAQAVLDAERGAEDVDLEHPLEVGGLEVDDQARDLDARRC